MRGTKDSNHLAFNLRSRAPNSLSSSPLLRTKYNSTLQGLRGVDIVRTSLPTQQERQRKNTFHETPIASRDLVTVQRNDMKVSSRWGTEFTLT